MGFLNRQLQHCHQSVKKKCYESYVRPILEYSSALWDPYKANEINQIEKVQRRAVRFISGNFQQNASVTQLVNDLMLPPLSERRTIDKLIVFQKALTGKLEITITHLKQSTSRTRNSALKFEIPHSRTNQHLHSFFPSTIRLWNSLPTICKQAASSEDFKSSISFFL